MLHQDLNGDGVIGVPSQTSSAGASTLAAVLGSMAHDSFAFAPVPNSETSGTTSASTVEHIPDFVGKFATASNDIHSGSEPSAFQWSSTDHNADLDNHHGLIAPNIHYAELTHAYLIH